MKTWVAKPNEVQRKWWIVDASGKTLGRLATEVANRLRGKHKPQFTPHVDTGDFVIVVNSEKIEMTGKKWDVKKYYRHSRFFGSLKSKTAAQMREDDPGFIIEDAVMGMLPKNKLSRQLIKKLKAYQGPNHPHATQKPESLTLKD